MQPTKPQQPTTLESPASQPEPTAGATVDSPLATVSSGGTVQSAPSKGRKKSLIVAGAIVGVLVFGGTAGAVWWTSPQKAFDDAMSINQQLPKGGSVKGSVVVKYTGAPDMTIDFDTKYRGIVTTTDMALKVNNGAVNLNLTGGFATDTTRSVFFKLNDIRKTIKSVAGDSSSMIDQYYGGLINKIDGKWVEVKESDLKDATKDSGTDLSCVTTVIGKITSDRAYVQELTPLYEKNKYITIKDTLGSEKIDGRDSNHYVVNLDQSKLDTFTKSAENTKLFKELKACATTDEAVSEFDKSVNTPADTPAPRLELWIDKWSHKLTKMVVAQDSNGSTVTLTVSMTYDDNQAVSTPKADTQFKDLQKDVETLQQMFTTPEDASPLTGLDSI